MTISKFLKTSSCILGVVTLMHCSKSTTEDISAVNETPKDTTTVSKITYKSHVKAIIDNSCISCHGASDPDAGLPLVSYAQVKQSAEKGSLIARMNDDNDPMPTIDAGGKLPQATLNLIDKWKADGFLED